MELAGYWQVITAIRTIDKYIVILRRLIIVLSLLLAISPVSVAYSYLINDSEAEQSSHCDHSSQQQSMKSCCQNDQCNGNHCMSLQCSGFIHLQALSSGDLITAHHVRKLFTPAKLLYGPDNGPPNTLFRPPIYTL